MAQYSPVKESSDDRPPVAKHAIGPFLLRVPATWSAPSLPAASPDEATTSADDVGAVNTDTIAPTAGAERLRNALVE